MTDDPRKTQDQDPRTPPAEEGRREAEREGGSQRKNVPGETDGDPRHG
ncbi:hypothetical protein [Parvularcula dongshanensis]|uniref:Uncharacterized protein n=1 Tax=Parvularcula dongshanensis TaxID=1173995 RepID=A0A840I0M5_9PROT|nr:hypothetical protein [Parvularcula dongshanensis]MBB4657794.1 hypothetical protein [Parvularcula dongshanensis]